MKSRLTGGTVLLLAALATGCAMCQSPFDYCAPVVPPSGCPNCDFGARRGSMFRPQEGTPATTPVTPTLVPPPASFSLDEPNAEVDTPIPSSTARFEADADEPVMR